MSSELLEQTKRILAESLQLGARVDSFDETTPLLGALPELDSMAVVTVLTAVEDQYGIIIDDDEISAETFESLGSLASFIEHKLES